MSEKEPSFSLNDFKKWMSGQSDKPKSKSQKDLIGLHVESKLTAKKLAGRIEADDEDLHELAKEFRQYGGIIIEVDQEEMLTIQVESGTFKIPKFFVRKIK